ncbi:MAG: pyridoxal phosphate-dependent aminotransferase [Caldilineaceae bacterium]|nr:pyridoxal phosphate-dependent aminotransferase [Caldilineaceae bacterium]MCB0144091.1 pyridoxal phosphate-dependent aminotransferase [Caldilineaceae bacterium]
MSAEIPLAPSLDQIQPSRIRELANAAFGMEGVLRLQFGESTMPTPQYIKDAVVQAIAEDQTFYSENAGLPSLRAAIAAKYAQLHGVQLDPMREVMVTASGVQALNVGIRCVIEPGDEALILSPNWPNSTEIVRMFGAQPVEIPLVTGVDARGVERFQIDFASLEAAVTARTRLLVYTSPSNPLGWVATVADQQGLLEFCRRHKLWLLADEVYERLYYGTDTDVAPSILRLCTREDAVFVAQSFSKSYCMTGWRLGWLVGRADMIQKAAQLNEFVVSHAATFVQRAGEAALSRGDDEVRERTLLFRERMLYCYEALSSVAGIAIPKPEGAFYLFPRIDGLDDSFAFALALLKAEKVAVAPGVAFGNGGEGAFRICYAPDMSVLEPAMERIVRFVERY